MHKLVLAALIALVPASAVADTLIYNVNGIQVDADGKLQRFGGLVIDDQGKVQQLIQRPEELKRPIEREVDGQGRTLLPGLIDAHGHVMGLGLAAIRLDLVGTRSIEELQQRLRTYAAQNPDGWILGRGWNQELWPDKRMPTAADLDAVVSDRPVWLERVDGHASVGNSAALRAAGITVATKDPTGGKIERDPAGNPTGLFIDAAAALVEAKVPAPSPQLRDRALAQAQEMMLSTGVTAAPDMGTSIDDWNAMRRAGEAGRLQVRIMSYASGLEPLATITRPTDWLYGDRLRMGGVKIYGDGALGSRGAWLKAPYHDAPDTRGLRFLTDAEMLDQAGQAAAAGFQVAIHAIGDAANEQVIRTFETLASRHPGDRRWRIEHVQVLDRADIPRIAGTGIIASMQPIHQVSDQTMAEARLGPDRLAGAYAWNSLLRSGARLAFGSDFPVEPVNPFLGLSAAVSRQDPNGVPPGGWQPQEKVSFETALASFTRSAAYAGFAEARFGSLEPGKWADFILIDRDVSQVDPQALADTQVLETWVAGEKVWERVASGGGERGR